MEMEMHISREDLWTESIFYIQVPEVDNRGIIDLHILFIKFIDKKWTFFPHFCEQA